MVEVDDGAYEDALPYGDGNDGAEEHNSCDAGEVEWWVGTGLSCDAVELCHKAWSGVASASSDTYEEEAEADTSRNPYS